MAKPKIKLRVVIKDTNQYGLYWHAEFEDGELYYGFRHQIGEVLRGSYHKSGVNFLHILQNKNRGIDKQSERETGLELGSIKKPFRVIGVSDSLNNIKWDYKMKSDATTRKTLVLDREIFNNNFSPCVDLWAVPSGKSEFTDDILGEYKNRNDIIFGTLSVINTNPAFLVVVWGLSNDAQVAFEKSFRTQQ